MAASSQQQGEEAYDPRILIGRLFERVDNLVKTLDQHVRTSHEEHNTVHDIVVAQSESVRIIVKDVGEMKPIVKDYELKANYINDTIEIAKAYNIEKAQREGATKLVKTMWIVIVAMAGVIGTFLFNGAVHWLHTIDKIPH